MPTLRFKPGDSVIDVPEGTLLIDAIRSAGRPIASSCGSIALCAKCGVRVIEGRTDSESDLEREAKRRNRVPEELRLACAIRVHEDLVVTADYWGASG